MATIKFCEWVERDGRYTKQCREIHVTWQGYCEQHGGFCTSPINGPRTGNPYGYEEEEHMIDPRVQVLNIPQLTRPQLEDILNNPNLFPVDEIQWSNLQRELLTHQGNLLLQEGLNEPANISFDLASIMGALNLGEDPLKTADRFDTVLANPHATDVYRKVIGRGLVFNADYLERIEGQQVAANLSRTLGKQL